MLDFARRAIHLIQKIVTLLPYGLRWRWLALLGLAVFVSVVEVVAAALIVLLLGLSATSSAPPDLPLVGDVSRGLPSNATDGLLWAAVGLSAFFLFRGGVYLMQSYFQNRLAYRTGAELARRLLRGYLSIPYEDYLGRNSADMIRNAHESTIGLAAHVLFPGTMLIAELFVILALSIVLIAAAPGVAAAAFVVLGVLVLLLLRFVQPRLLLLGQGLQVHSSESLKWLQQSLHGLRDIRVSGRERFFVDTFGRIRSDLAHVYGRHGLLVDIPRLSLETGVLLVLLVFLLVQASTAAPASENMSVLALFGYAAFRMLPSVNRIVNSLQALRFSTTLVDILYRDVVAADRAADAADEDPSERRRFASTIELRDVSYRYPGSTDDALSRVSLVIRKGESVGIIGRTGSGKSTLLDVILGLLPPTIGEVLIDGRPLGSNIRSWQSNVGVVPQTIFLLDDTVRNNVAIGVPPDEIDEQAVVDALRVAQLTDVVAALPRGLDSVIGERGLKLSGGQRQRLAIARAMYNRPRVLVLDEGLSALDAQTEAELLDDMSRDMSVMTIISVAHRASTIRMCDRIVVLSEGLIAAEGPFDELVRAHPQVAALMRESHDVA